MIIPFIPEDLFELNNNLQPKFDGEVIIIDNIFKNYQNILDICHNIPVEQWKTNPISRNFKDYYDCRPTFKNHYPTEKDSNKLSTFNSLIKYFFKETSNFKFNYEYSFNYFKNLKKDISKDFQHHPHIDKANYNVLIYIDPFENGGTALYKNVDIINNEEEDLFFNISNLEVKKIIKSKPNRCVIFNGKDLHGGYIENHNTYYYNWRINLVHFAYKV